MLQDVCWCSEAVEKLGCPGESRFGVVWRGVVTQAKKVTEGRSADSCGRVTQARGNKMTKHVSRIQGDAKEMAAAAKSVSIQQPNNLTIALEVAGTAPLIQNNFSQKAVEQMLRKHMGFSVTRETKKPREVIEAATIRNITGAVCLPPTGFKKAMLTASTQLKTFKKTQLRTSLFIEGNSIPITYEGEMVPRMDMVRTAGMNRTPDVRFRPSFNGWKARIVIQFSDTLTVQSVMDLLQRAGRVGVGEWRPEKDGTFGTFKVVRAIDTVKEVDEVRVLCEPQLVPLKIPDWALDADIDPEVLKRVFDEQGDETGT